MDQAWHDAHIRATSWISLGLKENILTDAEITDHLRIVSEFVNGDLGADPNTLPGGAVSWFKDKNTDSNWARYCDLLDRKGWDDAVIQSIEKSTRITMNSYSTPRMN